MIALAGLSLVIFAHWPELMQMRPNRWAALSAWTLILLGAVMAQSLDGKMADMLRTLVDRRAISMSSLQLHDFLKSIHRRSVSAARFGSFVSATVLIMVYLVQLDYRAATNFDQIVLWLEFVLELCAVVVIGQYCGRIILYGRLGSRLRNEGLEIRSIVGHWDQTCGLKPIGDFYSYQAQLALLPALFFGLWTLLMPYWPTEVTDMYDAWFFWYLGFFIVFMFVQLLVFVLPIVGFSREMSRQKSELEPTLRRLHSSLIELQEQQRSETDAHRIMRWARKRNRILEEISLLEESPTWPVGPKLRSRMKVQNIAIMALPVVTNLYKLVR